MSEDRTKPQSELGPKNPERREAVLRFAKYTAPAVLAVLVTNTKTVVAATNL